MLCFLRGKGNDFKGIFDFEFATGFRWRMRSIVFGSADSLREQYTTYDSCTHEWRRIY